MDPNASYIMDTDKYVNPSGDKSPHRVCSRDVLKSVNRTPIVSNSLRGMDEGFDDVWEETIHGKVYKKRNNLSREREEMYSQ